MLKFFLMPLTDLSNNVCDKSTSVSLFIDDLTLHLNMFLTAASLYDYRLMKACCFIAFADFVVRR